jgi:hypothetical protein
MRVGTSSLASPVDAPALLKGVDPSGNIFSQYQIYECPVTVIIRDGRMIAAEEGVQRSSNTIDMIIAQCVLEDFVQKGGEKIWRTGSGIGEASLGRLSR